MVEAWASYFQELASPADHDYDSSFARELVESYRVPCELPLGEFPVFTCDDVREVTLLN